MSIEKIWIFEIQDAISGGFIIADNEEEAWKRLASDRNCTVKSLKDCTVIYPVTALDLNNSVHGLW